MIAMRYARCWEINGRLVHGYQCQCADARVDESLALHPRGDQVRADTISAARDAFFRVLNMEQRTGDEPVEPTR